MTALCQHVFVGERIVENICNFTHLYQNLVTDDSSLLQYSGKHFMGRYAHLPAHEFEKDSTGKNTAFN